MNKRIVPLIALIVVAVLGVSWFVHRQRVRALNSGAVYVREQSPAPPSPKPLASAQPSTPVAPAQPSIATAPSSAPAPAPAVPMPPQEVATTTTPAPPPAHLSRKPLRMRASGDTIPRNPPNGLAFAGSGKYQLYRQGDITWRLNTETGDACILFATDAQWSRTRVFQSGCASHRDHDESASLRGN